MSSDNCGGLFSILLPAAALAATDTAPPSQSPNASTEPAAERKHSIFILDWELAQISSAVFDLGQLLAELYLLLLFRERQEMRALIDAFLTSYGPVAKKDAFDVVIHCGVHLMVWPWRVPGWEEGWEEKMRMGKGENAGTRMEECVGFGRALVGKALSGDEAWFGKGVFGRLFR